MKQVIIIAFFTLLSHLVLAQVTITVLSIPANTPANASLFIAGTFNNWNPNDPNFKLQKIGDTYSINLPASTGIAEYKFTRGGWESVEGDANGNTIKNRTFTYAPDLIAVSVNIEGWEDIKVENTNGRSTALPNVKVMNNKFYMPELDRNRRIWIYLPDDYAKSTKRYPVLYMQDGQNVFDHVTSLSGEWGVDETLNAKEKAGDRGCIIVAIDNGGSKRFDEYSPYVNPQYGGGEGKAYVEFIVNTLKPHVDSIYRTLPDRENTGIIGSSLGGLISLYAALDYDNVFSKVGVFSPAFWFTDSLYAFASSRHRELPTRFYFVSGQNESLSSINQMDSMINLLKKNGHSPSSIMRVVKADGAHSEWFWRREFGACYDWLFNSPVKGINAPNPVSDLAITLTPNPASTVVYFNVRVDLVQLTSSTDRARLEKKNVSVIDVSNLPNGDYSVAIKYGPRFYTKKLRIEHP